MRTVSGIRDADSLKAWLEALPQETEAERDEARRWAVAIAHRAAMRVLPFFWNIYLIDGFILGIGYHRDVLALPVLRVSLISGLAAVRPTPRIKSAAAAAAISADTAVDHTAVGDAHRVLAAAHAGASVDAGSAVHARAALAVAHAADAAAGRSDEDLYERDEGTRAATWKLVRADCAALANGHALDRYGLWQDGDTLAQDWIRLRPRILANGEGWRFWVEWYDNALHGRPQDYDLLTKIALIDPKDWDKGADHVNALIAGIRAKHIAETRPLGEDAIAPDADGVWHRVGRSDIDRDILQDAIDSVRDEIARVRGKLQGPQANMFTALIADIDLLDARLARYPDRPLRLHDTFLRVQANILHNLDTGELPDDVVVRDLNSALGTAAMDMRNACPKTKSVVDARIAARFDEADEGARADLVLIAEAAATQSDAELAEEFREDAQVATDLEAPEAEKKPALYRLVVRLVTMVTVAGPKTCAALIGLGALSAGVTAYKDILYAILRFVLSI